MMLFMHVAHQQQRFTFCIMLQCYQWQEDSYCILPIICIAVQDGVRNNSITSYWFGNVYSYFKCLYHFFPVFLQLKGWTALFQAIMEGLDQGLNAKGLYWEWGYEYGDLFDMIIPWFHSLDYWSVWELWYKISMFIDTHLLLIHAQKMYISFSIRMLFPGL